MGNWTRKRTWHFTQPPWIAVTTCPVSYAALADCLSIPGARGRRSSAWPWISMTTIDFAPETQWLWALSRARSAFRGITACTDDKLCGSVGRFAVDENGDLQLQHVAIFAEAESHQLHATDVARFPFWSLKRLFRLIGG